MKILIVDDIFTNRMLLRDIIRSLNYDYVESENGKQALEIIRQEDVGIVLMDIEMPVMNGLETTRYIREVLPHPKNRTIVVAITAHNPHMFFEDYQDAGFDQIITKPYNAEKIQEVISIYERKA